MTTVDLKCALEVAKKRNNYAVANNTRCKTEKISPMKNNQGQILK